MLPFAQRVALAVDAGMRELLPTPLHAVVHPETLELSVVFPTATVITGSGSLTLPRISIGGQGTVEDRRGWFAGMSGGQILAVVLVWLVAYALPIYLYSQAAAVVENIVDRDPAQHSGRCRQQPRCEGDTRRRPT